MKAMGTLTGGIAHDFNNLLMAIQGRTSIMLMNKDFSHPDFEHLRGIEGHVESAAESYDRMKDINPKVKVLLSSGYSINGQA